MIKPVRIREIMATDLYTLTAKVEILSAMRELLDRKISGATVLSPAGDIVGMLSKKDCLKAALNAHYHHVWAGLVGDYMVEPVETMDVDTDLVTAARIFTNSHYRRFPVVERGKLVGQISRGDVLESLTQQWGISV